VVREWNGNPFSLFPLSEMGFSFNLNRGLTNLGQENGDDEGNETGMSGRLEKTRFLHTKPTTKSEN